MMLDALVANSTNPIKPYRHRSHPKNRATALCRCIFNVYTATYGTRAPWEVLQKTPEECERQVKAKPVTIIDTTAEVIEIT